MGGKASKSMLIAGLQTRLSHLGPTLAMQHALCQPTPAEIEDQSMPECRTLAEMGASKSKYNHSL